MATPAAIEAAVNTDYNVGAGSPDVVSISQTYAYDGTYDSHYVVNRSDELACKAMWVLTTTAETAANQALEIEAALLNPTNDPAVGP